jgi:AraC-like DNA-binding protein
VVVRVPESRSRRGLPDVFDFEGSGDEARQWLDSVYGTSLRLTGPLGKVRHHREDHGSIAFDHIKIDATFTFDSDPLPVLLVVDVFGGTTEYSRDGVTDRLEDGGSTLVTGWGMPFTGQADHPQIRVTTVTPETLRAAVEEVAPGHPWRDITFSSYQPRSAAAGARWRATVDQLSSRVPDKDGPPARDEAARLLGHTLLQTFPNDVVVGPGGPGLASDAPEAAPSTIRLAARIIEEHAHEDLSAGDLARECGVTPRALQYAFRKHLECTPQDYLRRVRLDLARQALRDGSSQTVGDAAANNGFFNPGRFASDYRRVFDENPAQTLQRSNN